MTPPIPQCQGFTHPFVLLVRNTLRSRSSLEPSARITTSSPHLPTNLSRYQRPFSSCRSLCNKRAKMLPPTATPLHKSPTSGPLADKIKALSYAQRLAMKPQPTTLYEAAPHMGFLISSYGASFFCFGSAAINSWFNVFNIPPGISPWVPVGFGVVSFVFAALGTVFALRPSSIIRSIRLLPNTAPQQARGSPPQRILLEITARRIAPIPLPVKRMRVEPDDVVLMNRMQHRPVVLSREAMVAKRLEDAKRRKEEREYELDHLMTAPFRDAGRALGLLGKLRRGLTGEGFAPVFIKGVQYKLDIEGGYALENGQVLDRLVKIQPDPSLARLQSESQAKNA